MRSRVGFALLSLSLASLSCGGSSGGASASPSAPATVSSLAISSAGGFTNVGQQIQFTSTATLSDGTTQNVSASATWQSSNATVLAVSASGLATSIAEGDVKVTATYQAASATSDVSVRIRWSVQGRIVGNPDGAGVAGAAITMDGALAATSAADGAFTISAPGAPTSKAITVSANGFVTRNSFLSISGARTGVSIDLISLASPFSLTFYREFLRGAADNGGLLQQSFRWEVSPSFYINTRNGSSDMPASVISELAAMLPSIVTQVSDGRLSVQRIETGTETRPTVAGWINVVYTTSITSCGNAALGGNIVRINPICSCLGSVGIHETTHALGFWHHTQQGGLMSRVAPTPCSTGLSAIEVFHTKVAYSRPRGNLDPDADPPATRLFGPEAPAANRTLACGVIR